MVGLEAFETRELRAVYKQPLSGSSVSKQPDMDDVGCPFMVAAMVNKIVVNRHRQGFFPGGIDNEVIASEVCKRAYRVRSNRLDVCFRKMREETLSQCAGLPLTDAGRTQIVSPHIARFVRLVIEQVKLSIFVPSTVLNEKLCQMTANRTASDECDSPTC